MRVVLDTGILIASLITIDTPPALVYQAWLKKRFELVTSDWQLDEFHRVSRYPRLRKYLKSTEAGNLVNGLRYRAVVLEKLPCIELSPDPDDNPVLAMAQASRAGFLVTGDKRDLLSLGSIEGTRIVTARKFIELLNG